MRNKGSKTEAVDAADPSVVVVIVNYRTPELTKRCLAALSGEKAALPKLKVVVVDGGSGDASAAELGAAIDHENYRSWTTFLPLVPNGGFGWANNQAILTLSHQESPPEFIHLLNPDAEVLPGAVARLVEELRSHPRCAAAGSQLLSLAGDPAASSFNFPSPGREFVNGARSEALGRLLGIGPTVVRTTASAEVDWVTGASVMLRSAALRETGLFDDGFFLYFDEVELMHRMKAAGWKVRHVPESRVIHFEGASTGLGAAAASPYPRYWYESRRRYFALTEGRVGLLAANLARLAGTAIAKLKKIAGRPSPDRVRTRDLLCWGLWPTRTERCSSAPAWGDLPGKPPAWMQRQ